MDSENDELGAILFILVKLISRNVSWLTELNRDALEFKWVHKSNCSFPSTCTLLEISSQKNATSRAVGGSRLASEEK